jgi:cystathionine gamma-synthase
MSHEKLHPATRTAKADDFLDTASGAIVPGIHPSTTFARDDRYNPINSANLYTRDCNPTYLPAERMIAELEGGEECALFASGMAAVAAVFYTLRMNAHAVIPDSMYWGVLSWVRAYCERVGIQLSEYDPADIDSLDSALQGHAKTDLIWVETPSNPLMSVTDLSAAAAIANREGALMVVDNTVATPVFTRPIEHGAHIVMHSATKSLNGNSDVLAGALVTADANSDAWQVIKQERHGAGALPGSFEAWLLQRGMRTLFLRVERAAQTAQFLAEKLNAHPAVSKVRYPGLVTDPGHEVALKQMHGGFGSLLSFEVVGGKSQALAVAGALEIIISATSLGGVETLIEHRHSVEPPETQLPENLLRLAVGIEDADDLWNDLDQALSKLTD